MIKIYNITKLDLNLHGVTIKPHESVMMDINGDDDKLRSYYSHNQVIFEYIPDPRDIKSKLRKLRNK